MTLLLVGTLVASFELQITSGKYDDTIFMLALVLQALLEWLEKFPPDFRTMAKLPKQGLDDERGRVLILNLVGLGLTVYVNERRQSTP